MFPAVGREQNDVFSPNATPQQTMDLRIKRRQKLPRATLAAKGWRLAVWRVRMRVGVRAAFRA